MGLCCSGPINKELQCINPIFFYHVDPPLPYYLRLRHSSAPLTCSVTGGCEATHLPAQACSLLSLC